MRIRDNIKFIFEVSSVQYTSPSTISRCGVVNCENKVLEYEDIVRYTLDTDLVGVVNQEKIDHIKKWVVIACAKGFPYIERMCKQIMHMTSRHMALSTCHIIKSVLDFEKPNLEILEERGEKWTQKALERLVMYAYFWGIGTTIKEESFSRFER